MRPRSSLGPTRTFGGSAFGSRPLQGSSSRLSAAGATEPEPPDAVPGDAAAGAASAAAPGVAVANQGVLGASPQHEPGAAAAVGASASLRPPG
eukprot:3355168-Prymnesium_polylepis.1